MNHNCEWIDRARGFHLRFQGNCRQWHLHIQRRGDKMDGASRPEFNGTRRPFRTHLNHHWRGVIELLLQSHFKFVGSINYRCCCPSNGVAQRNKAF